MGDSHFVEVGTASSPFVSARHADDRIADDPAPEAVWATITDVSAWPEWGATVTGARVDGDVELTSGIRGTITTIAGVPLPFEITEFVDQRLWAWKVAGVDATRHEVIPVAGGCVLSFGAPVWAAAYLPVLAVALPRIERIASRRD